MIKHIVCVSTVTWPFMPYLQIGLAQNGIAGWMIKRELKMEHVVNGKVVEYTRDDLLEDRYAVCGCEHDCKSPCKTKCVCDACPSSQMGLCMDPYCYEIEEPTGII